MLGTRILSPSLVRPPSYDSARPAAPGYSFACISCGASVQLDLGDLSARVAGDETLLGAEHVAAIREHFDFNLVGKSHDGGGPQLCLVPCPACDAEYLVYLGVQEPSNGHVLVTVQGITQWIPDAP